ncbi:hypothetical protein RhiirA5_444513 [Rhizophagus irregularis]|uniref:Protein kinase domain-containing protein n=1 Tax=Rhizophagus irregularis TaxID=588596 RepID=A0A2N0ND20_9GLOM|nr:hypothetical protein RhiirA5_444513 [Rhizophagus irregularis]
MTKGGYGIIYKATWSSKSETVVLKRFKNSKYFLNEINQLSVLKAKRVVSLKLMALQKILN